MATVDAVLDRGLSSVSMTTSTPDPTTHKIRWFVYEIPTDRSTLIPRTSKMRGLWSYEAQCVTCGVETRTGGATETHIRHLIDDHKDGADYGWFRLDEHRVPDQTAVR